MHKAIFINNNQTSLKLNLFDFSLKFLLLLISFLSQILKAYSNYIEETLLELKIQLSSARQFASSLIEFEKGIYEIWDDSETQLLSVKKKSIEELQDKLPLLQWRPFFQSYFDDKVIKSSTLVALYSPEYFTKLYFLIQHYEAE